MNETVITLFGAIDRYWYNKNYLKYFLGQGQRPARTPEGFQLWR